MKASLDRLDWHQFFAHWQKDAKLWLILMGILTAIRIALCSIFVSHLSPNSRFPDILDCFLGGMKFDARFALIGIAPTFLFAIIVFIFQFHSPKLNKLLDTIRFFVGWFCVVLTILIGAIDIGFFYEYHDQFNQWIFGVLYDDWRSLALTVWHQYPIFWINLALSVVLLLTFYLLKRYLSTPFCNTSKMRKIDNLYPHFARLIKIPIILLTLFLVKFAITCTFGWHSLSRKDTAVTNDPFLNNLVYNPYYALYSTAKDFEKRNSTRGLESFIPNGDILTALNKLFPNGPKNSKNKESLIEDWLEHTVSTPSVIQTKPQHVFLVVMESQDSWPLLESYADLNLAPNLKRLAQNGIHVKSFISAGVSTMPALTSIIMGIPDVGIETQYQPSSREPFATAIATQFKALGYKTNLFYAGYLSWRKIGELALNQGFDNVYGCAEIDRSQCNEWGANDKSFYDYVLGKLSSSDQPTFNLLMTASNHPPYSIDPHQEGWQIQTIPDSLKHLYDGATSLKILGHFWYADKCLGEFVDTFEKAFPQTLFAITGDHWSRRFLNSNPTLYERKSVPLIFYGPEVLKDISPPQQMAGCHLDIAPTLINFVAPEGFSYCSMGGNILDPGRRQVGFGANVAITPNSIVEIEQKDFLDNTENLSELFNAFHAIGWWRIMQGSKLKSSIAKTE